MHSDHPSKDHESSVPTIKARLEKVISHFSMARKIVRLAHFLEPLNAIAEFKYPVFDSQCKKTCHYILPITPNRKNALLSLLNSVIGVFNDLSDDCVALIKIGVIDKSWGSFFTRLSDRLWLSSILLDLREVNSIILYLQY